MYLQTSIDENQGFLNIELRDVTATGCDYEVSTASISLRDLGEALKRAENNGGGGNSQNYPSGNTVGAYR